MAPEPRHIVSYFEHEARGREWTAPEFGPDLEEILSHHFNTVIFCVSEETLASPAALSAVQRAIHQAKDAGLTGWADPWGVGKFFGGEGISYLAERGEKSCFCNPKFDQLVMSWLRAVSDSGVDGIFWDEPETKKRTGCQEHGEADIIGHYSQAAAELNLYSSVCIPANYKKVDLLAELAAIPWVNDIATDPYWPNAFLKVPEENRLEYIAYWTQQVKTAAGQHGKDCHLWLQGFDIRAHDLDMMRQFAATMRQNGVHDLALWGFRGCASLFETQDRPELASPQAIWEQAREVFATGA